MAAFPWFSTAVHRLLFAPGTWEFTTDETLLEVFPIAFWRNAAIIVAMPVLGAVVVLRVWSREPRG